LSFYSLLLQLTPAGVIGKAEGFAAAATGGGTAAAASPKDLNELVTWLSDGVARTIVLDKTWDFTGSMGSKNRKGLHTPVQHMHQWLQMPTKLLPSQLSLMMSLVFPPNAIKIGSNKSIVGVGSAGKIKGRGFYIAGAKNIIIQNVEFVEMNPKYIWGGDAISVDGTDLLWIDHVKISRIGRQFITMGPGASNRVSITNSEFDGSTLWSAKCNNHHYWTLYFTGSQDSVTFKGNYIHNTSGRGPKPNVFLQAANNYWSDIAGNAFQIGEGAKVLAEGNIFEKANTPVIFDIPSNPLWSSSSGVAGCASALGRNCQANSLVSSGSFAGSNTDVLTAAKGMSLAPVADVGTTKANVLKNAGIGKI
ncbi:Pectin lyase 1, partial [Botrytis cinerea]